MEREMDVFCVWRRIDISIYTRSGRARYYRSVANFHGSIPTRLRIDIRDNTACPNERTFRETRRENKLQTGIPFCEIRYIFEATCADSMTKYPRASA